MMKIKEGFLLHALGGQDIVVTVGKASKQFHGMLKLNATGAFIWRRIEKECTMAELVEAFANEYELTTEQAEQDVTQFLNSIKDTGCIIYD